MSGPRLSIIPAGAVTDRSLEPRDLQVLCLLGRHLDKLGWCVRSQVKMAVELDCGRSSVQRSLERLCDAGWVEKKRRGVIVEGSDPGQPNASYAYRVVLDRDDYAFENAARDGSESHAETASDDDECPPVGTPADDEAETQNHPQGAQPAGHGGAQPEWARGAQPYVGTKNDPLERSSTERERDARARETKDRKARFIVSFEQRWPTAAADDRQRTAYAAEELTEDEETAALNGIGPFLDNLKRLGRKNVPAGWKYLEERRWTLLEAKAEAEAAKVYPLDSPEGKAVATLYDIAGKRSLFDAVMKRGVSFKTVTPQVLALEQTPPQAQWIDLAEPAQVAAWDRFIAAQLPKINRAELKLGDKAPWPWPPSVAGKVYTAGSGPPGTLMSEDDAEFMNEQTGT